MTTRRLMIVSVVLNLVLLAVLMSASRPVPAAPPADPTRRPPSPTVQTVVRTEKVQQPDTLIPLAWKEIESAEYKTYISNLRGIGCPEETVRDIVIADISKLFARRWRALNPVREYKYWRYGKSSGDAPVREANERRKTLESLLREKRRLVRDLLGVDLAEDGERYADPSFRGSSADMQAFDFLPQEKRQVLREIRDKYEQLFQQIYDQRDPDNFLQPGLVEKAGALRKESENEIQNALTQEEWEQFELRFSGAAQDLRNRLAGFEPNEDEFRRIFSLRKTTEDPAGLDERIKGMLSPARYAEYQMSQDRTYLETLGFARAWDLSKEVASAVFGIRQTAERQAQAIPAGTDEERAVVLAAIRAEVENSLRQAMGDKPFNSYSRSQSWLRGLGR